MQCLHAYSQQGYGFECADHHFCNFLGPYPFKKGLFRQFFSLSQYRNFFCHIKKKKLRHNQGIRSLSYFSVVCTRIPLSSMVLMIFCGVFQSKTANDSS